MHHIWEEEEIVTILLLNTGSSSSFLGPMFWLCLGLYSRFPPGPMEGRWVSSAGSPLPNKDQLLLFTVFANGLGKIPEGLAVLQCVTALVQERIIQA